MVAENEAVVRKFLAIYNDGAWDRLDEVLADTYAHHNNDATLTAAQFVRGATWVRNGLPDFRIDIADLVADADRVAVRFIGTGTHVASMFGEAPTAKIVALHGIVIYRIAGGRIAEDWEAMDEADLRRQVGAPGSDG